MSGKGSTPGDSFLRRHWQGLVVIFGCWTLVGFFYATRPYLRAISQSKPIPEASALIPAFADAYSWALFTPLILWLVRRFPFRRDRWPRALAIHLGASALFAAASVTFNTYVGAWVYDEPPMLVAYFAAAFHWNVQWYWMIVGIAYAVQYYRESRERQLRASRLEAQLVRAQLQALKMQIQPHFLFNTLHAISELVHESPDAADRMITRLGDLLRLTVDNAGSQEVTLKEELEFLQAYLEIEQTRFGDRLQVQLQIPPETLDARVPNLVLQPLVENAIRHGTAGRAGAGLIAISAQRSDGRLQLQVRDNGAGLPEGTGVREGVGLGNTRARLEQLYGAAHRFDLRNAPYGGVVATVVLPYHVEVQESEALAGLPPGGN